jgi:hypothetical protein
VSCPQLHAHAGVAYPCLSRTQLHRYLLQNSCSTHRDTQVATLLCFARKSGPPHTYTSYKNCCCSTVAAAACRWTASDAIRAAGATKAKKIFRLSCQGMELFEQYSETHKECQSAVAAAMCSHGWTTGAAVDVTTREANTRQCTAASLTCYIGLQQS